MRAKVLGMRAWLAAALAAAPGPTRAAPPPDLKLFAADAAISDVSLAPDGKTVAFLQSTPQGRRIELLPEGAGAPRLVDAGRLNISGLDWIDGDHLLILHQQVAEVLPVLPRQTITQGVAYNIRTGRAATLLDGMAGVVPLLAGGVISYGEPGGKPAVFARGLIVGPMFNLFRIDPETGRGLRLQTDSLDGDNWVVDASGAVLAETFHKSSRQPEVLRVRSGGRWREVDLGGRPPHLVGLGRTPGTVLLSFNGDLHEVGADGGLGPSLQPPGTRVRGIIFDGGTRRLSAMTPAGQPSTPIIYDAALATAWSKAARAFAGKQPLLVGASADATQLIVAAAAPGAPPSYFWANLKTGKAELIGETAPQFAALALPQPEGFAFAARDGLPLKARLYPPAGGQSRRAPVVVLAASWPDGWPGSNFNPMAQALALRGYAVLQVAVRGEAAWDEEVASAGEGEFGRKVQTDLSDGLAAAVARGGVDPTRACIVGAGVGGYAALAAVTVQHAPYRCAVAVEPVADLRQRVATPDVNMRGSPWRRVADMRRALGADASGPGLAAVSPMEHAAEGAAPVLLVQEADDPLDQVQETDRMRAALARAHRRVDLVTLKAKTQRLSSPEGREALYAATLAFLAKENPV